MASDPDPDQSTTQTVEHLSSVYNRLKGKVTPQMLKEYADLVATLYANKAQSNEQRLFVSDYLKTISLIESEKVRKADGELNKELKNLPEVGKETIKLHELVTRPEIFDGEKPKPRRWLQEYNEAIIANGWTDKLAIKYLPTFLSRSAKDWYWTEVRPFLSDRLKWVDVADAFSRNYLGDADYEQLSQAIDNMRQKPGESVSNFIPRFRRLLLLLSPSIPEEEQLRQLRSRLRPEYKALLALADPKSLTSLKSTCLKIEAGFVHKSVSKETEQRANQHNANKKNTPNRYQKSPNRRSSSDKRYNNGPRSRSNQADAKKSVICHTCDRPGHIAKDCFATTKKSGEPIRRNTEPKQGKSNINTITNSADTTEVLCIRHGHGDKASRSERQTRSETAINHPTNLVVGGGKLLEQKVVCNSIELIAVVDTGAYVSVVDESLVLQHGWKITNPTPPLVGADGKRLDAKGSIDIRFELRLGMTTKVKYHSFAVVKNLTAPLLLGLELMRDLSVIIDTSSSKLMFKSKPKSGARLAKEVVLPARSQSLVKAQVNHIGTVLISPFKFDNGIQVANSVAAVENNQIPVVILNPANKEAILREGTQLASWEEYELIDKSLSETGINLIGHRSVQLDNSNATIAVGHQLNENQVRELIALIQMHSDAFSLNGEIGYTCVYQHDIELLPGTQPIAEPLRRRALIQVEETRRQVKKLLKEDIIEESSSPWASAYVLAKKKNGEFRLCIDFRRLNLATKKVAYPLPNIEDCLETLSGRHYFSQLDFASGFWQIPMKPEAKELTAFRTEDGLFQFKRMPFGLTNAPASFQRTINAVLSGVKGLDTQVFMDDVCVATHTWPEHVKTLERIFRLILDANLKLQPNKCVFGASKITFLGHELSGDGIRQDPEKLKALVRLPAPTSIAEVRRALGMFSYYRKFVLNFAMLAEPLTRLTRKGVSFVWGDEQKRAYDTIIANLEKNACLAQFNHVDPIILKTDASKQGVAGILLQKQGKDLKLVTCCSRRLTTSEANYGITDLEGLAVVYSVTKFRPYLLGKTFQIVVDHCALCSLNKNMPNSARLRRWAITLSEYNFEIVYTKGRLHEDVDCLSRAPVDDSPDSFIDNCVYLITPLDSLGWRGAYSDDESKNLFQQAFDKEDGLRLIDDIIYRGDKLYVPSSKRDEIIRLTHSVNMNAHPGIHATVSKLKESYWWPKMIEDVTRVIGLCQTCLSQKPSRVRPAGLMNSFQVFRPGEQVAIDLIEDLPESQFGNKHIVVAIDMFSRFVEAKAVPDKGAPSFTLFLLEYCGRYGVPHSILTDNSTTFCNAMAGEVLKVFGASHCKSTPHHHQGNAIVERVNQTIEEKIRLILDDPLNEQDWDSALPIVLLAINTSYHGSIGCSPFEMTFGNKPPLQDKMLTEKASPHDTYTKLIKKNLKDCHSNAVAIQAASQERSKVYFEKRRRSDLFDIDDAVLIKAPERSAKLAPKYLGPYKVIGKSGDIYQVEDMETKNRTTRHVSDLRHIKTRTSSNVSNPVRAINIAALMLLCITAISNGDILFERVKPVIWLTSKSIVSPGTADYDINFAYASPCSLFQRNIESSLRSGESLSNDDQVKLEAFSKSCKALYIMEWQHEIGQLLEVKLPVAWNDGQKELGPYKERSKRAIDLSLVNRTVDYSQKKTLTIERAIAMAIAGPLGTTALGHSEREMAYRERLSELLQLRNLLNNLTKTELYMERLAHEDRLSKRDTSGQTSTLKVNLPTDFTYWEITKMIICPWCIPSTIESATERTYRKAIAKLENELKEKLKESNLESFMKSLVRDNKLSKRSPVALTKRDASLDLVNQTIDFTSYTGVTFSSVIKSWLPGSSLLLDNTSEREKAYRIRLGRLTELAKELDGLSNAELYMKRLGYEGRISKRSITDAELAKSFSLPAEYTGWDILSVIFCPPCYPWIREHAIERTYEKYIEDVNSELTKKLNTSNTDYFIARVAEDERIDRVTNKREKRGIFDTVLSEIATQTVGVFTGNIVSNLVSFAFERINPNSNTNRLSRLETAYEDLKKNFEITKQVERGILDNIDKLSNIVQETVKRLNQNVQTFPQYTWLASLIVNKITQSGLDLQRIADEARKGRLAIEPFARLTGLTGIKEFESQNTRLISITRVNEYAINFKFTAVLASKDTKAYKVHGFTHWDNLDDVPRLLKYVGADYLIYNDTSNCIKSLPEKPDDIVSEQCTELDGEDPALNQWTTIATTDQIERYANESQVRKTIVYNYIYCFPGQIEIDSITYKCPFDVFRLRRSREFKTAKQRHIPTLTSMNTSQTEIAIDAVHAGHFNDDSDVVQHLALFEQLRNERHRYINLTEDISESFVVKRRSIWLWSFVSMTTGSWLGAAVYLIWTCWFKSAAITRVASAPNQVALLPTSIVNQHQTSPPLYEASPFLKL